jgi:MoaA/NifB/PqqE/SkfB family radical SAM enzyme
MALQMPDYELPKTAEDGSGIASLPTRKNYASRARRGLNRARSMIRAIARRHPRVKQALKNTEIRLGLVKHTAAELAPDIIRPNPRKLTVAITSYCNLRCVGCRYGRDFMPGRQLPLGKVRELLEDAKAGGIETVRLYGGEPLLHRQLPDMINHGISLGLSVYVTTNGLLLKQKIDELYQAGLRSITIGFYGTGHKYDAYVQRADRFARLEESIATVRERYGSAISLQLNFLLMRPSCNSASLHAAWRFAERYDMSFHIDLVHYSLPYFTEGPDHVLQFNEEDRPAIVAFVRELAQIKERNPQQVQESWPGIWSIPDWLLKKEAMRVPCDAYQLIWVGTDGTVQLCYVTFRLGNIYEQRLRDMLFASEHRKAAKAAFLLSCPNCHCERDSRVQKHLQSLYRYRANRIGP